MYLDYWDLKKFPFDNVPDPDFFFLSKPHKEALTRVFYAVEMRKGCTLLTGDIGCGKTTLGKVLMQRISGKGYETVTISNPCQDPTEFLKDILYKLHIPDVPDSKVEILRLLGKKLTENMRDNKETVLIIDEAQLLNPATLEEIRLLLNFQLSNRFLLTICLFGQPDLLKKVRQIRQLEQRIAMRYVLRPFKYEETVRYVLHREKKAGARKSVFSRQAVELVYRHSNGLPRVINNVCDLALLVGYGEKRDMITSDIIREIIDDGAIF